MINLTITNGERFLKFVNLWHIPVAERKRYMRAPQQHRYAERQHPVFHDPTGRRIWRIMAGVLAFLMMLTAMVQIWIPMSNAPLQLSVTANDSAPDYPRRLLASTDTQVLPHSDNDYGVLTRLASVQAGNGQTSLIDPITGEFQRNLENWELDTIGGHKLVLDRTGEMPDHTLALTFDDGPDPVWTPQILDILAAEHVPATFFVIGENVAKYPEVFQRLVREGHMAGNHTFDHNPNFSGGSNEANQAELIRTDHIMRAVGDYSSPLFRLPEGDPDHNLLGVLTAQWLGYVQVDFDIDTKDWLAEANGQTVAIPELDGKGHVMLMHDGGGNRAYTLVLLRQIIQSAKTQGYKFTTVAPIIPAYYLPTKIQPTLTDYLVNAGASVIDNLFNGLRNWLFVFGIGSVIVIGICVEWPIVLHVHFRQKRQHASGRHHRERPEPTVIVVIPAYNEAECIIQTLAALRASTYNFNRVIVVDDGSTDNTYNLATTYRKTWSKLHVVYTENGGKSSALNIGVGLALAVDEDAIVVLLDADTQFEPETIARLIPSFDDPFVGAAAGQIMVSNRWMNLLTGYQSLEYTASAIPRTLQAEMNAITVIPGACGAWRAKAIAEAGGFTEDTLAEDNDMTMTIRSDGWKSTFVQDARAWTQAPWTISSFAKQRLRWGYGTMQALWKHRAMMLNPSYGWLGMVTLPYAAASLLIPLLFMPLMITVAVMSLIEGNWQSVVLFSGFIFVVQFVTAALALWKLGESEWRRHLLLVPAYRPIFEILQVFVLYMSLTQLLLGKLVKFYRPKRMAEKIISIATEAVEEVHQVQETDDPQEAFATSG